MFFILKVKDGDIVIDLDGEMFEPIPGSFNQVGTASTIGKNLLAVTVFSVITALWI